MNELAPTVEHNSLTKVINETGVEFDTAEMIQKKFSEFYEQAEKLKKEGLGIKVTDISQKDEMKSAREIRLEIKEIRVQAEKARKLLKEDSNRYGKAVQAAYNLIEAECEPTEKYLELQEKFAEVQAAKEKAELKAAREKECQEFSGFMPTDMDLSNMPKESYEIFLSGLKATKADFIEKSKKEAEARLEQERLAKEKAEQERIAKAEKEKAEKELKAKQAELEKQKAKAAADKKKADEALAKAKAEKEALERKAEKEKADRIAKENAEKARLAKIEADRLAEKAETERRAAEAPDLEKLSVFAQKILLLVEEAKNIKLSTKSADDTLNAMVKNLNIAAEKGINNER